MKYTTLLKLYEKFMNNNNNKISYINYTMTNNNPHPQILQDSTFNSQFLNFTPAHINIATKNTKLSDPGFVLKVVRQKKQELSQKNNKMTLLRTKFTESHIKSKYSLPKIKTAINREDIGGTQQDEKSICYSLDQKQHNLNQSRSIINKSSKLKSFKTLQDNINSQFMCINQRDELQQLKNTQSFKEALNKIPRSSKNRNQQNMQSMISFLQEANLFFKNCPKIIIATMLKISQIKMYEKNQKIYTRTDELNSFFIILWGKVRLTDLSSEFKKVSKSGQTLSQQILFDTFKSRIRDENAKAMTQTALLQMPYILYKKLYEQLVLHGYKTDFLAIQNLIRRNYLVKQSLKSSVLK